MSAIAATSPHPSLTAASVGQQPRGQRCFAASKSSRNNQCRLVPRCQQQQSQGAAAEQLSGFCRRQLLQAATLLGLSPAMGLALPAAADEAAADAESLRQAFFDITVDRKPLGRIVIEVPASAPTIGGQRFLDLSQASCYVPLCCSLFSLILLFLPPVPAAPVPCRPAESALPCPHARVGTCPVVLAEPAALPAPSARAAGPPADLAQGKEGVAFRKTRFELIEDTFIQVAVGLVGKLQLWAGLRARRLPRAAAPQHPQIRHSPAQRCWVLQDSSDSLNALQSVRTGSSKP